MSNLSELAAHANLSDRLRDPDATMWLALYSDLTGTETQGGTELAVANGYARIEVAFSLPANRTTETMADYTFGPNTHGTDDWAAIDGWVVIQTLDAIDYIITWGELYGITVGPGQTVPFKAGIIKVHQ